MSERHAHDYPDFGPEPMTPERAAYLRGYAEGSVARSRDLQMARRRYDHFNQPGGNDLCLVCGELHVVEAATLSEKPGLDELTDAVRDAASHFSEYYRFEGRHKDFAAAILVALDYHRSGSTDSEGR